MNQKELRVFGRELLFDSFNKLVTANEPDTAFFGHVGVKISAKRWDAPGKRANR